MRLAPALLALAAAGGLGACQATAPAKTPPTPAAAKSAPVATAAVVRDETATAPVRLHGLDRPTLQRRFGRPSLARQDGSALVLAYRLPDCVLHLFLYPDERAEPRVRYAAAIGADRASRDVASCLP